MNQNFEQQSETRKTILTLIKQNGFETISSLKKKLTISSEGIRLQLVQLERDGFVKRHIERNGSNGGRPAFKISLTSKGESLFPKKYDTLTVELFDTVASQLGNAAVKKVLSTMVDARVSECERQFSVLNLAGKIAALKDLYTINDQFMEVEHLLETNTILIKEHNCPFHDVAMQRPILCSVTLNTLTRLLGCRVVREKRFQDGDGCCVFRAELDQPIETPSFSFEEEK